MTLTITMRRPVDLPCVQRIETVEQDIPLAGTFTPGVYRIFVNAREYSAEL